LHTKIKRKRTSYEKYVKMKMEKRNKYDTEGKKKDLKIKKNAMNDLIITKLPCYSPNQLCSLSSSAAKSFRLQVHVSHAYISH